MCQALVSIVHEIAVVDAEVEAAARHIDTVPIVREGAELELACNNDFFVFLVHHNLTHMVESDFSTVYACDFRGIRPFHLEAAAGVGGVNGKRHSVQLEQVVVVVQDESGVDGKVENHAEAVAIEPTVQGHAEAFAVGNQIEFPVAAVACRCLINVVVKIGSEGVVAHFGIDGQPGIVGVVDVLRFLEVGFRAGGQSQSCRKNNDVSFHGSMF